MNWISATVPRYKMEVNMATVTINGTEYDTENLSQEANAEINMLANVEKRLLEAQVEVAILQTAKNAYANRLTELLSENSET